MSFLVHIFFIAFLIFADRYYGAIGWNGQSFEHVVLPFLT